MVTVEKQLWQERGYIWDSLKAFRPTYLLSHVTIYHWKLAWSLRWYLTWGDLNLESSSYVLEKQELILNSNRTSPCWCWKCQTNILKRRMQVRLPKRKAKTIFSGVDFNIFIVDNCLTVVNTCITVDFQMQLLWNAKCLEHLYLYCK